MAWPACPDKSDEYALHRDCSEHPSIQCETTLQRCRSVSNDDTRTRGSLQIRYKSPCTITMQCTHPHRLQSPCGRIPLCLCICMGCTQNIGCRLSLINRSPKVVPNCIDYVWCQVPAPAFPRMAGVTCSCSGLVRHTCFRHVLESMHRRLSGALGTHVDGLKYRRPSSCHAGQGPKHPDKELNRDGPHVP